jgi:hypothetical protein
LEGNSLPPLQVSAPPEFVGQSGLWTPGQLLIGATASGLTRTFLAIPEFSSISISFFRAIAKGKLEKIPGEDYCFTEIDLATEVGVIPGEMEKAQRARESGKRLFHFELHPRRGAR